MIARRPLSRVLAAALLVLAVGVGGAALAWACTPDANVGVQGASGLDYGSAGSQATVNGAKFATGAEVQIRWNSAQGPVLATATGPTFSRTVTIPDVPDGNYVIVATGVDENGIPRQGAAGFLVGERPSTTGERGGPAATPAPKPDGGSGAASSNTSASTTGADTARGGRSAISVSGGGTTSSAGGGERSASLRRANAGGVTTLPSGQTAFTDSIGAGASGQKGDATRTSGAKSPSARSANGDLWGGFASGKARTSTLGGTAGPSDGPSSALTLSMALSGFGLVALLAGVTAAGLRRRRALARPGAGRGSSD